MNINYGYDKPKLASYGSLWINTDGTTYIYLDNECIKISEAKFFKSERVNHPVLGDLYAQREEIDNKIKKLINLIRNDNDNDDQI